MADPRGPLVWSPEAESDLYDIWNYYAQAEGPQTADKIVRDIGDTCRVIEEHPLAGRSRDEIRPGLRSLAASPFVVFYVVRNNVAHLVRILDGRRDIDEIFTPIP